MIWKIKILTLRANILIIGAGAAAESILYKVSREHFSHFCNE